MSARPWGVTVSNDADRLSGLLADGFAGVGPLNPDYIQMRREQTMIVRRSDSHDAVARLREQDGDALVFGSRMLWTDLLAHGLVGELHLMIGPKIVAGDHHTFAGVAGTDLRLLDVRCWDDSDNVVPPYASAPA